jgi:cyclopropane fatty-acyl-phospholipid synthase-like methyltransferase
VNDETRKPSTIDRSIFQNAYAGKAPWDIGGPQPAFRSVADEVIGSILDSGCGPGDNALFFAARGHEVTGFDFLEEAVAAAKRKSAERGLAAKFLVKDALKLQEWRAEFDNVIDSGLFHVFSNEDRILYVRGLESVLKRNGHLFLLCFSDQTPGTTGPRRVSQIELRDAFREGWVIESIEPARFEVRFEQSQALFSGETPWAWFLVAKRSS